MVLNLKWIDVRDAAVSDSILRQKLFTLSMFLSLENVYIPFLYQRYKYLYCNAVRNSQGRVQPPTCRKIFEACTPQKRKTPLFNITNK